MVSDCRFLNRLECPRERKEVLRKEKKKTISAHAVYVIKSLYIRKKKKKERKEIIKKQKERNKRKEK